MAARSRSAIGPAALLSLLCATLGVAAPAINGQAMAPRSVFLHLPADRPAPRLSLVAEPLTDGGWRLVLEAEAFRFTEICTVEAEAQPVGHAHVLVDGRKVASAYQPVIELGPLPPGRHDIRAVLRGQDHRALLGSEGLIEARITLDVPERDG